MLLDRGGLSGQFTRVPSTYTALRAIKGTKECDEPHGSLTRQCVNTPVAMSAVPRCVYLAWKHPRRSNEVVLQVT